MLMPYTNILPNVHLIKLPSLDNLSNKDVKNKFKDDGIHLTYDGLSVLENDLIAGVKTVFKDIKPKMKKNPPTPHCQFDHGGHNSSREVHHARGGYGHSDRDDRQPYEGNYRDYQSNWSLVFRTWPS